MNTHPRSVSISRRELNLLFEIGLAAAVAALLTLFILSKEVRHASMTRPVAHDDVVVVEVPRTEQPPPRAAKPSRPQLQIVDSDVELPDVDLENLIGTTWEPPMVPPPPFDAGAADADPVPWVDAETQPALVGGIAALHRRVVYPGLARRTGVEGAVLVSFVVGVDGRARDFEVLDERPQGLGFAEAAIEALRESPFSPGIQRDHPVAVRMTQALRFRLER